jgi:hypothetical protein
MNLTENVKRRKGFNQVCVWEACVVTKSNEPKTPAEFEQFMKENFKSDVQYLEEIKTGPDLKNGQPVSETGGRIDLFFAISDEHVARFAIPRLQFGIKWIEDVLAKGNYRSPIYPKRLFDYCIWNKKNLAREL